MSSKHTDPLNGACCLRVCGKALGGHGVEVVGNITGFIKQIPRAAIAWNRDGNRGHAAFHKQCYEIILEKASPAVTRAKPAPIKRKRTQDAAKDREEEEKAQTKAAALQQSELAQFDMTEKEKQIFLQGCETAEFTDSEAVLQECAKKTAELFKTCQYAVAFTGAGISTSSGIGDYRGKDGKWTQESTGIDTDDGVPYDELRPSYPHEAISKLMELDMLKYIISQNCDGLHILSGVPKDKIAELHGDIFMEYCSVCGHEYERSYYVLDDSANPGHVEECKKCENNHFTGRYCDQPASSLTPAQLKARTAADAKTDSKLLAKRAKHQTPGTCSGRLKDTIIHFGDDLGEPLEQANSHALRSDMMISLGSSMTVTPANSLVRLGVNKRRPFIIVNKQVTDYDSLATVRYFGPIALFLREVLKNILDAKTLETWEDGRDARLIHYNAKRVQPE